MARHHAYVGSYTDYEPGQLGWVGSTRPGEGITCFEFDSNSGKLTPTGRVTRQASPSWLEPSPDGQFLLAPHDMTPTTGVPKGVGFVSSYRIGADGMLEHVSTSKTGGRGNTCVSFDRTGRFLLLTRYWDGGITVMPFDPGTGEIGEATAMPDHSGHGPHPQRQASPHPAWRARRPADRSGLCYRPGHRQGAPVPARHLHGRPGTPWRGHLRHPEAGPGG